MLTIDAIANKNTIEIIGLDIFQLMLVAYGVIQIQEIQAAFTAANINDPSVPILLDLIPMYADAYRDALTPQLHGGRLRDLHGVDVADL